ncbi:MAG: sugar transferase [Planctomycetes bacterium]|nr:sugar transferase [Planctomycetota bacterium]
MVRNQTVRVANLAVDLSCVIAALSLAGLWNDHDVFGLRHVVWTAFARIAIYCLVWILVAHRLGTYLVPLGRNTRQATQTGAETWAVTWGLAGLIDMQLLGSPGIGVWWALATGMFLLLSARVLLARTPLGVRSGLRPRVLVIGDCASARSLTTDPATERSMDLVGYVPFPGETGNHLPHLSRVGELPQIETLLADQQVDVAMVCPSDRAVTGDVHRVFRVCDEAGLGVQYFPSFLDLQHLHVSMTWAADRPGLAFQSLPNRSLSLLAKRTIDLVGAAVGIVALLPVFLACAAAVKLTSKGSIFYRQIRVGRNGQNFTCYKFRTMFVGAHALQDKLREKSVQDGPAFKIPKDPRITPVGRILRKFSLDELPQMFNVLLGDMSLVGPRPPIPSEVKNYTWWQRRRISVQPGLTCVWQVWGRNRVSFKRWVEMDLYYIDNWSLWLDLKLIAHTFRAVLMGTGM